MLKALTMKFTLEMEVLSKSLSILLFLTIFNADFICHLKNVYNYTSFNLIKSV